MAQLATLTREADETLTAPLTGGQAHAAVSRLHAALNAMENVARQVAESKAEASGLRARHAAMAEENNTLHQALEDEQLKNKTLGTQVSDISTRLDALIAQLAKALEE